MSSLRNRANTSKSSAAQGAPALSPDTKRKAAHAYAAMKRGSDQQKGTQHRKHDAHAAFARRRSLRQAKKAAAAKRAASMSPDSNPHPPTASVSHPPSSPVSASSTPPPPAVEPRPMPPLDLQPLAPHGDAPPTTAPPPPKSALSIETLAAVAIAPPKRRQDDDDGTLKSVSILPSCSVDIAAMSHTSSISSCSSAASTGAREHAPNSGKWCQHCAGVGLHIAALLTELAQWRADDERRTSHSSATSASSKSGWKRMMSQSLIGDSRTSRSAAERARLQQQVDVLSTTVQFLSEKLQRAHAYGDDVRTALERCNVRP